MEKWNACGLCLAEKHNIWAGFQGEWLPFSSCPLRIPVKGHQELGTLLLDPGLCGVVCPSDPPHLVFWRVDTSLLSEESLLFRIQMVIRKKAKLICRNPTRHVEYIPHLYSFLLAHWTPNPAGKKLLHFIAVIEKVTNHPVTLGLSCPVTGVTNFQFTQFTA